MYAGVRALVAPLFGLASTGHHLVVCVKGGGGRLCLHAVVCAVVGVRCHGSGSLAQCVCVMRGSGCILTCLRWWPPDVIVGGR